MNQLDHPILPGATPAESLQDNASILTPDAVEKMSEMAHPLPWIATWVVLISLAAVANAGLIFAGGGSRGFFIPALAAAACLLAAFFDAFTLRIPNHITYSAALLGLAVNAAMPLLARFHANAAITWFGAPGATESLLGLLICGVLGLVANAFAGIHGGDLKLLVAVGALLGLSLVAQVVVVAILLALVYAVINLALMGRLNLIARIGAQRALELFYLRRFHTPAPETPVTPATHIPMAIPMALGMVIVLYLQVRHGAGGAVW